MILAAALFALALGPEVPLSTPSIDAAAGEQMKPSLAWYGDSLAAAWIDSRDNDNPSVRIAQLDALGHPKGFAARAYGSITSTRLAANGAATPLIATSNFAPTFVGPAGLSGRNVKGGLVDLVTNGSTYLLVTLNNASVHAEVLDSIGDAEAITDFGSNVFGGAIATVPFGGAYHVIYTRNDCFVGCSLSIYDTIVREDGTTSTQLIANGLQTPVFLASAATNDRLLIAWTAPQSIELLTLTPARTLITHTSLPVAAQHVFAGSDGNELLVAWTDQQSLQATRVSPDGLAIGDPFTLASLYAVDLTFARTPSSVVLAWSDNQSGRQRRNVFTRAATNFAGIAAAPTTLASLGYTQQDSLSIKGMPVWSEGENHTRIASSSGTIAETGGAHALLQPVAASGSGSTLVAWRDLDLTTSRSNIVAKFNNDAPIVIGDSGPFVDLDVVFDGANFFVFWSNGGLYRTRFTAGGTQLETTTLAPAGHSGTLSAARIGDKAVVAWIDGSTLMYEGRPVARTSAKPHIASDDRDQPFLVWSQGNCVMTAHRVDDALFVALPLVCGTRTSPLATAVAWDGTEFVIAWSDTPEPPYRNVHYMRTQRNAAPIDAQPLDVSARFHDTFGPSLVPSPSGVTLGYARVAAEEPFDVVSRVFTRTIERLGTTPRERAIGR